MTISVITPSYNSSATISRAINSVLLQDYTDYEHIVVDGGSTDGTIEILKEHAHLNWVSEPDRGQPDAMNKGFRMSAGNIIVYLNADDEFAPGIFSKVVEIFAGTAHISNTMVIADLAIQDADHTITITKPSAQLADITDPDKLNYPYNPVSYFYHRDIQSKAGSFPEGLHFAMDFWFLLKAYEISTIKYLPQVAGTFHNYDNKTASDIRPELETLNVLLKYFEEKHRATYFLKKNWIKARRKLAALQKQL